MQQQQSQKPALNFARFQAGSGSNPRGKGDKFIMTYKESLKPWAVVRLLANQQWVVIGRYHSRSDADGHLQLCRQRIANIQFTVVFDLPNRKG